MQKQQNKFTHLTAIERIYLSFPARFLLEKNLLQGKILDFGCGFGNDVKLLQQKSFDITGYDPYYFPQLPATKAATVIPQAIAKGKFQGEITTAIPRGW